MKAFLFFLLLTASWMPSLAQDSFGAGANPFTLDFVTFGNAGKTPLTPGRQDCTTAPMEGWGHGHEWQCSGMDRERL